MAETGEGAGSSEPSTPAATVPEADKRELRVFVSSTFRDLKAERDWLAKRVFPELKRLCDARGVVFSEVDLRWGVTDEQKAEGKVLPVCLAWIKQCRPYFIGLLGERYGWVPDEISADLIAMEPWLTKYAGRSVTELEILHGVLEDQAMSEHAFFYFRDPAVAQAHAELQEGKDPEEVKRFGRAAAAQRADARRQQLAALKQRIRQAHRDGKLVELPREGFTNPEQLGALVLADLRAVIDREFPESAQLDWLAREALEQAAFSRSRSPARVYVTREEDFAALDAHAVGSGPPLVLLGESGSGKSALLANWAQRLRARATRDGDGAAPLVIEHHIGASATSADWAMLVRRVLGELERGLEISLGELPSEPQALRLAFANGLYRAAAVGRRVVLILDGLNQLEDRDQALDLAWLPPELPVNVRTVLATLPGRPLQELTRRGWPTREVKLLEPSERAVLIHDYLKQYGKELSPERTQRIASAAPTGNPLYLRALLEELRLWGEHETLEARIEHYLRASTPSELYGRIFARWEEDYEDDGSLVGDVLSLLCCARRGLSITELRELLARDGEPLPQAVLSPILLAAGDVLIDRSGLLGVGHDHARAACSRTYLPQESTQRGLHERIADYFGKQPLGPRKVDELPWQLARAEAWQKLYGALSDLEMFEAAWKANQYDVKTYWAAVEAGSALRSVDAYANVTLRTDVGVVGWNVSVLLSDTGHSGEALAILNHVVEHHRAVGNLKFFAISLGNQAFILHRNGQLEEAMELQQRKGRICKELGDLDGVQASLGGQALILQDRGQLDEALALYREQERICKQLGNLDGIAISIGNQARVLRARGQLDEAMFLLAEQERICRLNGNLDGLSTLIGNKAGILFSRGQLDDAMALYREQESICRQLGDIDGLQRSLGGQALVLKARGQLDEAMALHKEEERICRQLGDIGELAKALGNQATVLQARGQPAQAMVLHEEEEKLFRQLGKLDGLSICLGNQAIILHAWGQPDEAMALLKEQERICKQLGTLEGLARSLANQTAIEAQRGRRAEASKLLHEALELTRNADLTALQQQIADLAAQLGIDAA